MHHRSATINHTDRCPVGEALPTARGLVRGDRLRPSTSLRAGDPFVCPDHGAVASIQEGALAVELVTGHRAVLHLVRLHAGDIALPLNPLATPAAAPVYRALISTRIVWLRCDVPGTSERINQAREMLLAATMRQLTQLSCLPTSHRLYVELLRHGATELPSHGELAARAATTRETISREMSLLRRDGVISSSRSGSVLAPSELIRRIARALGVSTEAEAWESIGLPNLSYNTPSHSLKLAHLCSPN